MVNMIRHDGIKKTAGLNRTARFWLLLSGLLAVAAVLATFLCYRLYGLWGGIFIGPVALVAVGAVVWMVRQGRGEILAAFDISASDPVMLLISQSSHPCLFMHKGRAVKANGRYTDLAARLGLQATPDGPPPIEALFHGADDNTSATIFRLMHEAPGPGPSEADISCRLDGTARDFRLRVTTGPESQFWEIVCLDGDVDSASVRLSEAPIGLVSVDQNGRVLNINSSLLRWIGVGEPDTPQYLQEFIDDPEFLLESPRSPGRLVHADTRLVTHKGVLTPIVMRAIWQVSGTGDYVAYVAFHGHSSLSALPAKHTRIAKIHEPEDTWASNSDHVTGTVPATEFTDSPIALITLDSPILPDARIKDSNPVFDRLLGQGSSRNRTFMSLFEPVTVGIDFTKMDARDRQPDDPFDAVLKADTDVSVSMYLVAEPFHNTCKVYMVDISARKALEDQLVQSQKMQAVGRLVAEIAHDFNNLLAAIRLYTDTLLGRHPIGDPSYPELQQINANVNRAASLVKKLLAYSRKQTVRPVRFDVSETLSDIAVTLKQVLGEKVRLSVKHGRDLPKVRIDRNQIDTVLMNLCVNARDAMKEQGGGTITIRTDSVDLSDISDPVLTNALGQLSQTRFAHISVTDTGAGIRDEIKSRIFEPFFTTKAQSEGTGLGLSTVYGIIEQADGYLGVKSKPGIGTTFSIYLPEALGDSGVEEIGDISRPPQKRPPSDLAGQGNILFVEDEDSFRVIAARTLRKRGYEVKEAANGEEACEILKDTGTPFDLIISDVIMPGMDGPTLLKRTRHLLGEARIVFISGYAEEEFSGLLAEEPDVTFLPKPFTLVQLAEKVKAEIGG